MRLTLLILLFTEASLGSSGISDLLKNIQSAVVNLESNSKFTNILMSGQYLLIYFILVQQIKSDVPSKAEMEKLQVFVEENHKGKDNHHYLNSIEKQRRGWEEAREKAEEMSQIFDSLIITSRFTKKEQILEVKFNINYFR